MESLDDYKAIIDDLVKISESVPAQWCIRGAYPDTTENSSINKLLSSLSEDQRKVIALMLSNAKSSGIHDTLAYFSEKQNIDGLVFTLNGRPVPTEPFGTELKYDYIARKAGDSWPKL